MNLKSVKFEHAVRVKEERSWKGDVKNILLYVSKIEGSGWKQTLNSAKTIKLRRGRSREITCWSLTFSI